MRRALLKTAFVVAVAVLWIVFLVPASILLDAMFPVSRGPNALGQGDRLPLGILTIGLSRLGRSNHLLPVPDEPPPGWALVGL